MYIVLDEIIEDNKSKNSYCPDAFCMVELGMRIISVSSFEEYFGFIIETVRGIGKMRTCTYVFVYKVGCELYSHTYIVIHTVLSRNLL